jgi:non-homologous end joining protein Ku
VPEDNEIEVIKLASKKTPELRRFVDATDIDMLYNICPIA